MQIIRRKRYIPFLILFFVLAPIIGFFIYLIDPAYQFFFYNMHLSPVLVFFILLFMAIYSLFSFILLDKKKSVLIATFIISFLVLRFTGIRNFYYLGIVVIILFLIDRLYSKPPDNPRRIKLK